MDRCYSHPSKLMYSRPNSWRNITCTTYKRRAWWRHSTRRADWWRAITWQQVTMATRGGPWHRVNTLPACYYHYFYYFYYHFHHLTHFLLPSTAAFPPVWLPSILIQASLCLNPSLFVCCSCCYWSKSNDVHCLAVFSGSYTFFVVRSNTARQSGRLQSPRWRTGFSTI